MTDYSVISGSVDFKEDGRDLHNVEKKIRSYKEQFTAHSYCRGLCVRSTAESKLLDD